MQNTQGFDLVWWITAVDLPALASLFWIGWRNYRATENDIDEIRHDVDLRLSHLRQNLDAYKLDVAKSYASIRHLKDVEERLTRHLIRIEEKLDITRCDRTGGVK